jgi:hypothetical protein
MWRVGLRPDHNRSRTLGNSFITNHRWNAATAAQVAQAGRGRGKVENETNHVLNTKGDQIAQNLGPGKRALAALLLSRNRLAFLLHPVLPWGDEKDAVLRKTLGRRQTFCGASRALTRSMVFESWHHVMDVMIRGLELEDKLEAQFDTG